MKKLRVGVMGCANIALRTVLPRLIELQEFELVAVASRSSEKALHTAQAFGCAGVTGYQALLDDMTINAIYMPLPTGLHEEWVLKAIEAGKHILIEKSLAMTHASAIAMVKAAEAKQLLIMENFMFLYHSQHKTIKNMVANGDIGDIRCFRSSFGFPPLPEDNFRYSKSLGGGALLDAAAYTVRVSQLFLGNELHVAGAVLKQAAQHGVDIYGGAFLKSPDGRFSEVAFGFDNFYQCEYEIWGSKGKITAKKCFTPKSDELPLIVLEQQGSYEERHLDADDHFINILKEFHRCILEGAYDEKYTEILNQSRLLEELRTVSECIEFN